MRKLRLSEEPVTVIITAHNVDQVVGDALDSLRMQSYPIHEVILIDNHSTDTTAMVVRNYKKLHPNFPLRVIIQNQNYGLSTSYNLGAKLARTSYIVTMHGDALLPTKDELRRLVKPVVGRPEVVASGPRVVHPRRLWRTYPFWQRCLFARVVDKELPSGNGKFDCFQKDAYLQLGGYDERRFTSAIGSEDADMYMRLHKTGRIISTSARVIHNHQPEPFFGVLDWVKRQKYSSIAYGRYLQLNIHDLPLSSVIFFAKPLLALLSCLVIIHVVFIIPLLIFPFFYVSTMFTDAETRHNRRILLLPFIIYFLVFFESFWFLWSFLIYRAEKSITADT